jgi:hypothetical protein
MITRMRILTQMKNKKRGGLKVKETKFQEIQILKEIKSHRQCKFMNKWAILMILMCILLGYKEGKECL